MFIHDERIQALPIIKCTVSHEKGKYRNTDNTKVGIKSKNSYRKNYEVSG
jgi:hypothetical protein